jgi:hypothetical protein
MKEKVVVLREPRRAIIYTRELSKQSNQGSREYSIHSVLSERRCQADKPPPSALPHHHIALDGLLKIGMKPSHAWLPQKAH